MRDIFEVQHYDGAGRVGELTVPRADQTVQTPALLPVVNPHVQTIQPAELESTFGAEILITNSYILHGSEQLREPALEQGLHDLLDFSGAIMTDSGSFQLSEYGSIDVTTPEILQFQRDIGSDIGTPVDVPTPPDATAAQAREEQETTQERLKIAENVDVGDMLVTAPVQGSVYPSIREEAAREADATDLDVFPIGAVVPLMNEYRYRELVEVVLATKRGLDEDAPVHLFGAGHPMMFALAAALGCDLFDSAAYALYARDGRYLTVSGTERLEDLTAFPCSCPVCVEYTPADLVNADSTERHRRLAEHNLAVSFEELRRVRDAIRRGNLFELLERRARGHPTLLDGYRRLLESTDQLNETDPATKEAFFYLSGESARRPEVRRYQDRLDRLEVGEKLLLTAGNCPDSSEPCWRLVAPFGPVPHALSDAYPFTAELPDSPERHADEAAARGVARLVEENPETEMTVFHDDWPDSAINLLPDSVTCERLGAEFTPDEQP